MPTGPKGHKRRTDVIGNAVRVMHILTGEAEVDAAEAKDFKVMQCPRLGVRDMALPQRGLFFKEKPVCQHTACYGFPDNWRADDGDASYRTPDH